MNSQFNFRKVSPGWHYDKFAKPNGELRKVGVIELERQTIDKKKNILNNPSNEGGKKRVHIGDTVEDVNSTIISERIGHMSEVGYTPSDYFMEFINDKFIELEDTLCNSYNISHHHACAVLIPAGQCMPVHDDSYSYLQKYMKRDYPEVKYDQIKHIKRYLVFLTDWEWGQTLGAGNTICHQWTEGSIHEWDYKMLHWSSNASMSPILFFEITGLNLEVMK